MEYIDSCPLTIRSFLQISTLSDMHSPRSDMSVNDSTREGIYVVATSPCPSHCECSEFTSSLMPCQKTTTPPGISPLSSSLPSSLAPPHFSHPRQRQKLFSPPVQSHSIHHHDRCATSRAIRAAPVRRHHRQPRAPFRPSRWTAPRELLQQTTIAYPVETNTSADHIRTD